MTSTPTYRTTPTNKKKVFALTLALSVGFILTLSAGVALGAAYTPPETGGYIQGVNKGWVCWVEDNPQMPTGKEKICSTDALTAPAGSIIVPLDSPQWDDGVINEDEEGWDCKTMGNKICGPTS